MDTTIYRGDGYLPDAILETTSGSLRDLLPKIEAAAGLGADIELVTERHMDGGMSVVRRYRLKVFPKQPDADAREVLGSLALQHEKRQQAFDELHGPAGGPYADYIK